MSSSRSDDAGSGALAPEDAGRSEGEATAPSPNARPDAETVGSGSAEAGGLSTSSPGPDMGPETDIVGFASDRKSGGTPPSTRHPRTGRVRPQTGLAIEARHLSKTFRTGFLRRPIPALVDASLAVKEGCIFGLVGPNGAGKTTTIKILTGLIKASSGDAWIQGHPVPSPTSRQQVGFLPETPHFYDHLTPVEYLVFVGRLFGLSRRQCALRSSELLDFVGLGEQRKKPIRKFSKGMLQRLGIAQALVHDPRIVILDEPQSGLDPIGRKEVKDMIRDLKARGRTVFFSSHILPDVEDLADEIVLMNRGRVLDVDAFSALTGHQVLQWQIEVSDLPAEVLLALESRAERATVHDGKSVLVFPGQVDVSALASEVVAAGGRIHQMTPYRESLEDLFVREIQPAEEKVT